MNAYHMFRKLGVRLPMLSRDKEDKYAKVLGMKSAMAEII